MDADVCGRCSQQPGTGTLSRVGLGPRNSFYLRCTENLEPGLCDWPVRWLDDTFEGPRSVLAACSFQFGLTLSLVPRCSHLDAVLFKGVRECPPAAPSKLPLTFPFPSQSLAGQLAKKPPMLQAQDPKNRWEAGQEDGGQLYPLLYP